MEPITTVLADPSWEYDDALTMRDGVKRSSRDQYPTMTVQQICDLYTPSKLLGVSPGTYRTGRGIGAFTPGTLCGYPIADTAFLCLWSPATHLIEGIAQRVCMAWGFTPKQIVPWLKGKVAPTTVAKVGDGVSISAGSLQIQPGNGWITRGCAEYLIIATRGKYSKLVKRHDVLGYLLAPRRESKARKVKHSTKPIEQYAYIESLLPGPYLEIFACGDAPAGWISSGLDADGARYFTQEEPGLPGVAGPWPEVSPRPQEVMTAALTTALPEPPMSWD